MKFLICNKCKKIVEVYGDFACDTICCGETMQELKVNTVDAAVEKHIPVVTQNGLNVQVTVGEVLHPMEEAHYIEWIYVITTNGNYRFNLNPGDTPVINLTLQENEEVINALAYCNLHGLWAKEK